MLSNEVEEQVQELLNEIFNELRSKIQGDSEITQDLEQIGVSEDDLLQALWQDLVDLAEETKQEI